MTIRATVLLIAAGMLAGACGSTTTAETAATTATTSPAPTITTSTSPLPSTTTTTLPPPPPAGEYAVVEASLFPAEPLPGSGGAGGSGCAPGPGALPDGVWYGNVLAADESSVDFDLACFYFGDIAWEVAAKEGEEAPNDFWITNDSASIRTVPVAEGAIAWSILASPWGELAPLSFATEWPPDAERAYAECPSDFCGVWLYINQGTATELMEQYIP